MREVKKWKKKVFKIGGGHMQTKFFFFVYLILSKEKKNLDTYVYYKGFFFLGLKKNIITSIIGRIRIQLLEYYERDLKNKKKEKKNKKINK